MENLFYACVIGALCSASPSLAATWKIDFSFEQFSFVPLAVTNNANGGKVSGSMTYTVDSAFRVTIDDFNLIGHTNTVTWDETNVTVSVAQVGTDGSTGLQRLQLLQINSDLAAAGLTGFDAGDGEAFGLDLYAFRPGNDLALGRVDPILPCFSPFGCAQSQFRGDIRFQQSPGIYTSTNGNFTSQSITTPPDQGTETTPVPLPAGALLLLTSLAALTLRRRG